MDTLQPRQGKKDSMLNGLFAALITAQSSTCNCECVQILKKIGNEMKRELLNDIKTE